MKTKTKLAVFLFLVIQFFLCYFFDYKSVSYFLLAETLFFYLLIKNLIPFLSLLLYLIFVPSGAFVAVVFIAVYHFFAEKVKLSVKFSLILFLFLYFFTARYEPYLIKAVMPGFIGFVSVIYAITRVPQSQLILAPALTLYTVVGFVYGILFNVFPFFRYEPYLMFSVDVIQIVIATILFVSLGDLKKQFPDADNKHNEGEA